jgi:hypothetical protein
MVQAHSASKYSDYIPLKIEQSFRKRFELSYSIIFSFYYSFLLASDQFGDKIMEAMAPDAEKDTQLFQVAQTGHLFSFICTSHLSPLILLQR